MSCIKTIVGGGGQAGGPSEVSSIVHYTGTGNTAAAANTKGSWFEVVPSVPANCCGIAIKFEYDIAAEYMSDIGIGAAAAEAVFIPNVKFSCTIYLDRQGEWVFLPIPLDEGARISARSQDTTSSARPVIARIALFFGTAAEGYQSVQMWGANSANSLLTQVDPGAVANTKGAWVELSSDIGSNAAYWVALIMGQLGNVQLANYDFKVDIGIGAESAEVAILSDMPIATLSNADRMLPFFIGGFPLKIPANSRVSARMECTGTDVTDRLLGVGLLTLHEPV